METTALTRAGFKRRRTSTPALVHSVRDLRHQALGLLLHHQRKELKQKHLEFVSSLHKNYQRAENFLGSSSANHRSPPTSRGPCRLSSEHTNYRQPEVPLRRRRRESISSAAAHWLRLVLTLGCLSTTLSFAAAVVTAKSNTLVDAQADVATTSRLCAPAEGARAYVTTLAGEARGQVLGPRVLAQSLRSSGAKGDIVVLVPLDRASGANVDSLRRDGLTVHIVPRGLQTAGGEIASEDMMTKIFLWSLTSYDRVVYLDPRSLIQKNPDALFACEGFCAAGAVPLSESNPEAAAVALAAEAELLQSDEDDDDLFLAVGGRGKDSLMTSTWQPSTSVMVLEPSLQVHEAMLEKLRKTSVARASDGGSGGGGGSSLEAQAFVSAFLETGDHCSPFEVLNHHQDAAAANARGGWEEVVGELGGTIDGARAGGRGGVGSVLEDALQPVVMLNRAHMPRCAVGRERTSEGVCYRLPYTYAAPSSDFNGKGAWSHKRRDCMPCDEMPEPHIVHFADDDTPWTRLAYLHKPLFWRWNKVREQLDQPYGTFFSPWLLFFIPSIVLAFARVYYKTAGTSSSSSSERRNSAKMTNANSAGAGASGLSPSRRRDSVAVWVSSSSPSPSQSQSPSRRIRQPQHGQLAILPASVIPGSYDTGAVDVSSKSTKRASWLARADQGGNGGGGSDVMALVGSADHVFPPCLREGVLCYFLTALVAVLGFMWFHATRALSREVVDARWHPFISIAVYNAWLCCALVLGLYLMDYVYYLFKTRARTLLRDAVAVAMFVSIVSFLHARRGTAWAVAIGLGIIALGFGHGSRPESARCLSGRLHFRCITASCLVGVVVSLAVCYGGASAHEVASRRIHSAAASLQMVFTSIVYASVIGGHRLRADMGDVGLVLDVAVRSTAAPCPSSETLVTGTSEAVVVGVPEAGGATKKLSMGAGRGGIEGGSSSNSDERKRADVCALTASVVMWIKTVIWRRHVVAACLALLVLWPLSSSIQSSTPGRRLEKYGQSCLGNPSGFVEAGGKRLAKVCGAEQALRPVKTGAYFEAFRQDKVCLEVAGGGFLTLGRVHVAQACTPENQFVFQLIQSPTAKKPKPGSTDVLSSGPSSHARDVGEYCVYNPTSGLYLSAQGRPKASCGELEHWFVKPAPTTLGLSKDSRKKRGSESAMSMLLHPDFLSRGPLRTLYGYLAAATALLVARAVFAKLASARGDAVARSNGSGGQQGSGGGSAKHRHGGLGSRRNSRGRPSRPRNSGGDDYAGYFGDAGYAGDAEVGSAGYNIGRGKGKSSGKGSRESSNRPIVVPLVGSLEDLPCWGPDLVPTRSLGAAEKGLKRGGSFSRSKSGGSGVDGSTAGTSAGKVTAAGVWNRFLWKLFSGLCLACDATLLAGLWCLIPTHFAQALSSLTHDHNSAIQQGLGMENALGGGGGGEEIFTDAETRGLEEAAIILKGGEGTSMFGVGNFGLDRSGDADALTLPSCDGTAWWIMSALIRWHLVLVLVAFCHLHGAVAAAAAATHKAGRDRRTGKRIVNERVSFLGLRAGEHLAMRLRTGLGVLALLCVAATTSGVAGLGDGVGKSAAFLGLHAHPAWGKCAPAAGLDLSWGGVSPLLVFAVLAAAAGVYVRAGATSAVRISAGFALVVAGMAILAAVGRTYLAIAAIAAAMDWTAWGIAGFLSCVCYQKRSMHRLSRDSSGSAEDAESATDVGGGGRGTRGVGKRSGVADGSATRLRMAMGV